ncbi:MAG: A/G-specific adenine glycosylase [Dehalococcoidia bacterium]|nr:A/G-specific adenine glycosylase [Dehalococcoidia bacterium]
MTSATTSPTLTKLRRRLLAWYRKHGRDLPWRRVDDPYHAMVAEFMLQQTGVARVLPVYDSFLRRFPSLKALADAPVSDVIRAWSGMGYNRRAINLQRTARVIVDEHNGVIPGDPHTLEKLPGIGRYTAAAIACFAFQRPVAVMDTNIRRVLGRLIAGHSDIDADAGWTLAEAAVPSDGTRASAWHQALMDLGATVCSARRPKCGECPVNDLCAARPLFDSANQDGTNRPQLQYAELSDTLPTLKVAEHPQPKQQGWIGTTRYYRGRIVETLRNHSNGTLPLDELGPLVTDDYIATRHSEWLQELLTALERDGLVAVSGEMAGLPE